MAARMANSGMATLTIRQLDDITAKISGTHACIMVRFQLALDGESFPSSTVVLSVVRNCQQRFTKKFNVTAFVETGFSANSARLPARSLPCETVLSHLFDSPLAKY
jgi:hypothetical protein